MNYFSKIQNGSPEQKKRFALLASGTITLFIFGMWSLAKFGSTEVVARDSVKEVTPLSSMIANVKESIGALKGGLYDLTSIYNQYGR